MKKDLTTKEILPIDAIVQRLDEVRERTERGVPFWSARDLKEILAYEDWTNFKHVIEKAKTACNLSGEQIDVHFFDTTKMISIGKGAERKIPDVYLTRYACYLIAMNGKSTKEEVATAQSYFAVQTRKQEIRENEEAKVNRLELRDKAKQLNTELSRAAKASGVSNFGRFHNFGYQGLYNERTASGIKGQKGIPAKDNLLDRMGNAELGINIFRITQAEEKLKNAGRVGEHEANKTHYEVGKKTRAAVASIGGTMPEDLPAEPHIKEIKKQLKSSTKKLPKQK